MATIALVRNVAYFDGRDVVGFWAGSPASSREAECVFCGTIGPLAGTCCEAAGLSGSASSNDAVREVISEVEAVPALV